MGSFKGHSTRDLRKARSQNIRNRNVFSLAFSFLELFLSNQGKQGSFASRIMCFWSGHIQTIASTFLLCWSLLDPAHRGKVEKVWACTCSNWWVSCLKLYIWRKWWSFTNLENPETTRRRRLPWLKFDQLLKIQELVEGRQPTSKQNLRELLPAQHILENGYHHSIIIS